MSEWRDFLESAELTERQKEIYDLICELNTPATHRTAPVERIKRLLVFEFTGLEER